MMTPVLRLGLLSALAAGLMTTAVFILFRIRVTPLEKERRRRLMVNRIGRMSDALLTGLDDGTLHYTYSVNGVDYHASQDVTELLDCISVEPSNLIGNVTLKYSARNPANSILVCEQWSGLRIYPKEKSA